MKTFAPNSKYEINKTCNFNLGSYRKCEDICACMYCATPPTPLTPATLRERSKLSEPRTKRTALQSSWIMCVHRRISFSLHPPPPLSSLSLPFMHCHAHCRARTSARIACCTITKVFVARFCCSFFVSSLCNKMPRQEACQKSSLQHNQ